jgi:hypothetical protein
MFYFIDCDINHENQNDQKIKCTIMDYNYSNPSKTNIVYIDIDWNKSIHVQCSCKKKDKCIEYTKLQIYASKLSKIKNFLNIFNYICPHVKWFGLVYLNSYNYKYWSPMLLENFKKRNTYYSKTKGQNSECLICLENINYNHQNTVHCNNCKHSIHKKCWHEYHIISKKANNTCILCKSNLLNYLF